MENKNVTIPKIDVEFATYYIAKMTLYSENAKNYIQTSAGALVLTITFSKTLLGQVDGQIKFDCLQTTSWILFLLCIGFGLFYQYLAVKRIETRIEGTKPRFLDQRPGYVYFFMLITFYAGAIFFVVSAILRLK